MTRVFVPREVRPGESRVAATPETVKRLTGRGLAVAIEAGAGERAFFADADYAAAGAEVLSDAPRAWAEADVVLKVGPLATSEALGGEEVEAPRPGSLLLGMLAPHAHLPTVRRLAERRVDAIALELLPRVTRAQPMDALSSQASIAGYKAALVAADRLPKYFPLLTTAAGTIPAARVVVLGGGVAGLQALATAKRLGAVVEVSDVRPEVKEQVASLGGRFIDLPLGEAGKGAGGYAKELAAELLARQREIVGERVAAADVVITAAFVPGRRAPLLLTRAMVERMRPGSLVVDLALEQGGNCEVTRPGESVHGGVTVIGTSNLAASMPSDASRLYARNLQALLFLLVVDGAVKLDLEDEIVAGALLTHQGEVRHPEIAARLAQTVGA
jgi:NAD(P) transhydrogenase subunit alpha